MKNSGEKDNMNKQGFVCVWFFVCCLEAKSSIFVQNPSAGNLA